MEPARQQEKQLWRILSISFIALRPAHTPSEENGALLTKTLNEWKERFDVNVLCGGSII